MSLAEHRVLYGPLSPPALSWLCPGLTSGQTRPCRSWTAGAARPAPPPRQAAASCSVVLPSRERGRSQCASMLQANALACWPAWQRRASCGAPQNKPSSVQLNPPQPEEQRIQAAQEGHNELAVQQREVGAGRGGGARRVPERPLHPAQRLRPAVHRLLLRQRTTKGSQTRCKEQLEGRSTWEPADSRADKQAALPSPRRDLPLASRSSAACPAGTRCPAPRCCPAPARPPGGAQTWSSAAPRRCCQRPPPPLRAPPARRRRRPAAAW